jgi:hypothetical protein
MKFLRITAGYTKLDKKRNTEILRELNINSELENRPIGITINNMCKEWTGVRIPRQMMTYRPKGKRSLGRPLKRWREAVTGH